MHTIKLFHLIICSDDIEKTNLKFIEGSLMTTISPNSYGLSTKDKLFHEVLKNLDFLILDGVYFALASILLLGKNIKRNQGPDLFYHFMKQMEKKHVEFFS